MPEPPQLNTAGSIEEGADDLERYLSDPSNADVFGSQFHILAHSMGGLDARRLICRNPDIARRVLSLTTLGTPHQGTPFADIGTIAFQLLLNALDAGNIDVRGFADLTTGKARTFNQDNPDVKGVCYFSVAGEFSPRFTDVLKVPHDIIRAAGGSANDGLVPVASAKHGEFLGIWPADHFRLINQPTNLVPTPAESQDLTIVENYRGVIKRLADDGF